MNDPKNSSGSEAHETSGGRGNQSAPVATMRNVTVTFDSYLTRSLASVSFDVRRGEVFGLLGAAGSGKSTALRTLAGNLRPTEGHARVFGRSPNSRSVRARIGYLPDLTTRNRPRGLARFKAWLGSFLPGNGRRTSSGSGGPADKSRRRSELAAAIRGSRELVVLDDPFADLDPSEAREVKELIRTIVAEGRTVMLSGRNIARLGDVCDRFAVLSGGRMEALGTLDQLLASAQAIRFLAPVLPRDVSEKLLSLLRSELQLHRATERASISPSAKKLESALQNKTAAAPGRDQSSGDDVLDALVKSNADSGLRPPTIRKDADQPDAVDHKKLADLTKPESELPLND